MAEPQTAALLILDMHGMTRTEGSQDNQNGGKGIKVILGPLRIPYSLLIKVVYNFVCLLSLG